MHAGRIEWQASHAFVVRSVNRMFARTTGRPRDEIGRTAWELKSGTSNLDVHAGKKRDAKRWIGFSEDDVDCRRPIIIAVQCVENQAANRPSQRVEDNAFHPGSRARAQRDHFAQHAQTVAQKANFAALSVVPTHWNFANPQTGPMREIQQLHVEREAFDPRRFKNRSACLQAKRFKSALCVPKRQPGGEPHQQIKNTAGLLSPPRLTNSDQAAIQSARAKSDIQLRHLRWVRSASVSPQVAWKDRRRKKARLVFVQQVIQSAPRRPFRDSENSPANVWRSAQTSIFHGRLLPLHRLIRRSRRSIRFPARWRQDNRA